MSDKKLKIAERGPNNKGSTPLIKNQATILLSTSSPNIGQFSKFFDWHTQQEICNKSITEDSFPP